MVLNVLPSKQPEAPSNVPGNISNKDHLEHISEILTFFFFVSPGARYNCLSELPDTWKVKQEMEKLRLENQVLAAELKMLREKKE